MKSSNTSLFLTELIISILFFSLAAATCIQLFVKAHLLDIRTMEQNETVVWTENLAELWYAGDGDVSFVFETLAADYDGVRQNGAETVMLFFDKDFSPVADTSDAIYCVTLTNTTQDTEASEQNATISFTKESELFYQLPLTLHIPLKGGIAHE